MVSTVAMACPSAGGDSTAARQMPQRRDPVGMRQAQAKKNGREGDPGHSFLRGKKRLRLPDAAYAITEKLKL